MKKDKCKEQAMKSNNQTEDSVKNHNLHVPVAFDVSARPAHQNLNESPQSSALGFESMQDTTGGNFSHHFELPGDWQSDEMRSSTTHGFLDESDSGVLDLSQSSRTRDFLHEYASPVLDLSQRDQTQGLPPESGSEELDLSQSSTTPGFLYENDSKVLDLSMRTKKRGFPYENSSEGLDLSQRPQKQRFLQADGTEVLDLSQRGFLFDYDSEVLDLSQRRQQKSNYSHCERVIIPNTPDNHEQMDMGDNTLNEPSEMHGDNSFLNAQIALIEEKLQQARFFK
ncbi:uncharacterized protein DMAD_12916 [Drosophila madeirensis]|uniref:Uncharacterized protein n=1 Tax=Drosophila madeirensis TaxID=30013 RepID=A0AAU9FIE9_DROMD